MLIYSEVILCYTVIVVVLHSAIYTAERRDAHLFCDFIVSIVAGVTAYYICKWLDGILSDD